MSKWFCFSEEGLEPAIKTAVYIAGYTLAKNNKELAIAALPVAKGIIANSADTTDNGALNAMLKEAILELVPKVSKDPVVQAAVEGCLLSLGINVPAGVFPALSNQKILGITESFVAGMTTGIA